MKNKYARWNHPAIERFAVLDITSHETSCIYNHRRRLRGGDRPRSQKSAGGNAPAVAVTREVAPVNHGGCPHDSRGPCQR